ncbi:unnamed protein product [Amoebophrya sp. A25]|nr:unnamed protein product [Amoebophrya sp. A25]|eukprot:GSA25T00017158001.1
MPPFIFRCVVPKRMRRPQFVAAMMWLLVLHDLFGQVWGVAGGPPSATTTKAKDPSKSSGEADIADDDDDWDDDTTQDTTAHSTHTPGPEEALKHEHLDGLSSSSSMSSSSFVEQGPSSTVPLRTNMNYWLGKEGYGSGGINGGMTSGRVWDPNSGSGRGGGPRGGGLGGGGFGTGAPRNDLRSSGTSQSQPQQSQPQQSQHQQSQHQQVQQGPRSTTSHSQVTTGLAQWYENNPHDDSDLLADDVARDHLRSIREQLGFLDEKIATATKKLKLRRCKHDGTSQRIQAFFTAYGLTGDVSR